MRPRDLKAALAVFQKLGQTVTVEVRADGTTLFVPTVPVQPGEDTDPVMAVLQRGS